MKRIIILIGLIVFPNLNILSQEINQDQIEEMNVILEQDTTEKSDTEAHVEDERTVDVDPGCCALDEACCEDGVERVLDE